MDEVDFAAARAALDRVEGRYTELEQTNVSLQHRLSQNLEDEKSNLAAKEEAIAQVDRDLAKKIAKLQAEHGVHKQKMEDDKEEARQKARDLRAELRGLIAENEDEMEVSTPPSLCHARLHLTYRQRLKPRLSFAHGLQVEAASPITKSRTSRVSIAARSAVSEDNLHIVDADDPEEGPTGTAIGQIYSRDNLDDDRNHQDHVSAVQEKSLDTMVVFTTPKPASRRHKSGTPKDLPRSPQSPTHFDGNYWDYNPRSSQSRRHPMADPIEDPTPPSNHDNPQDEDSFSPDFSLVIYLGGKWHAFACHVCGANSPQSHEGFFNGVPSLRLHMRGAHQLPLDDLSLCITRTFDDKDIKELEEGLHPTPGPIIVKKHVKTAQMVPVVHQNGSSASPALQNAASAGTKHSRGVSDSPEVRRPSHDPAASSLYGAIE